MATAQSITLTSAVSAGSVAFGAQVATALGVIGALTLVGATYQQIDGQHALVLMYYTGGQWMNATVVQVGEGGDLDAAVAAWSIANPTLRPLRLFDLTPTEVRRAISQSVLIIHSTVPAVTRPVIARNVGAAIASGAIANVTVLDASGLTARTFFGVNLSDADWATDTEAYCVYDPSSGVWLCAPHCC